MGDLLEKAQLGIGADIDPQLGGNLLQELKRLGVFLLGQQVDLQIELVAPVADAQLVVLADQDKGRQKNRLQRNDQRQEGDG